MRIPHIPHLHLLAAEVQYASSFFFSFSFFVSLLCWRQRLNLEDNDIRETGARALGVSYSTIFLKKNVVIGPSYTEEVHVSDIGLPLRSCNCCRAPATVADIFLI